MPKQTETHDYHGLSRPNYTPEAISELKSDEVFVFGSNLRGMHVGGAARVAFDRFGAVWGQKVMRFQPCKAEWKPSNPMLTNS